MFPLIDHSWDCYHSVLPFLWSPFGFNTFVLSFVHLSDLPPWLSCEFKLIFSIILLILRFFSTGYHSVLTFRGPVYIKPASSCVLIDHLRDSMFFPVLPFPCSGFGFNTFVPTFVAQLRCQHVTSLLFQSLWQEPTSSNLIRRWSLMFLFIHGAARIWSLLLFLSFVDTGHWTVAFLLAFLVVLVLTIIESSSSPSKSSSLPTSECWIRSRLKSLSPLPSLSS